MFKYSGVTNYALRNLKNNQIYLSDPKNFNDPFETRLQFRVKDVPNDLLAKAFIEKKDQEKQFKENDIEKLMNGDVSKEEFYRFMENHFDYFCRQLGVKNKDKGLFLQDLDQNPEPIKNGIQKYFQKHKYAFDYKVREELKRKVKIDHLVGVSCFSEEMNNLLMWSHYADKHKGFCIEFDKSDYPFSLAETIIYGKNIPVIDPYSDDINNRKAFFRYKSEHWKYEKELRIVRGGVSNEFFPYNKESLKAIYFGLKANKTDMDIICSIARANNPEVKFYKMEKKDGYFELESHPYLFSIEEK